MTQEEIEKLFLAWWQNESPKDIAYASTQNIAAVGFAAGVKAAQPLRAVDAAMPPSAEQNPRSNIVPAVESDTQPRP